MNERELQKSIIQYLQYLENCKKLYFIRNNVFMGKIQRRDGTVGYMRQSKAGTSDLIVFLKNGITLFIEVKSEKGIQNQDQIEFEKRIKSLGFEYHIVRDFDSLSLLIFKFL